MPRRLVPVVCCIAIMLGMAAPPAMAQPADPVLTNLNGLPDKRLDICLVSGNTKTEIVSNLRYGRFSQADTLLPGTWTVQARAASAGNCQGRLLASSTGAVYEAGKHYTLVFWRSQSAIRTKRFVDDPTLPSADRSTLTLRHVAKTPKLDDVWLWEHARTSALMDSTFGDVPRGAATPLVALREGQILIEAYLVFGGRTRRFEYWAYHDPGYAYQAYFIGDAVGNIRIVATRQAGVVLP